MAESGVVAQESLEFASRWTAFLEFMRPKLLQAPDAKTKALRLRQMTDLRMDKVAVKKPMLSPLEISVVVSPDKEKPKFAVLANQAGLLSVDEAKLPLDHRSETVGRFIDAALYLEVFPPEVVKRLLQEFKAGWDRRKAEEAEARAKEEAAVVVAPSDRPLPPKIEALLGKVKELWSIPEVTRKLQSMLSDANTPIREISVLIEKDPGLATQVLRMVNSAFYATNTKVTAVSRAVTMLGFMTTKRIITIASMINQLGKEDPQIQFDMKAYWGHSLWVAHGASALARLTKAGPPDDYFSAGLLHDVGKLVEYQYLKAQIRLILAAVKGGARFQEAEERVLEVNHAVIGATVCERWTMPADLVAAIQCHLDEPEVLEKGDVPRMAKFVAALCHLSKTTQSADKWAALLQVQPDQLGAAIEEAKTASLTSLREIFMFG